MRPHRMSPHRYATLLLMSAVRARETVSFNFGWRFHRGDPDSGPRCIDATAAAFPLAIQMPCKLSGGGESMLRFAPLQNAADCARACCPDSPYHPACAVWSFCDKSDKARYAENVTCGCYLGGDGATCAPAAPTRINWSGGRRVKPWPANETLPEYAEPGFDHGTWERIDAPHDFVVAADFSPNATDFGRHAFLPREKPGWYRKAFNVPGEWSKSPRTRIVLRFEGVFHATEGYLDGKRLVWKGRGAQNGYTSFETAPLRLHVGRHVIALRVDASFGSGHWYEGGGLYRDVWLHAIDQVHVASNSLFTRTTGNIILASVEVANSGVTAAIGVAVRFSVWPTNASRGAPPLGTWTARAKSPLPPGAATLLACNLSVVRPSRWSVRSPALYTVQAEVLVGGDATDAVNATTGFRRATFSASHGFALDGERLVLRGFSNHDSFAGVGAALPQRINLYRAQMLRAVGGNTWRMTHNPASPATLDLLDRLGILCWDENRDYSAYQHGDMAEMVARDRNHASIVVWGMCNEDECFEQEASIGDSYRRGVRLADPTRPLAANLLHESSGSVLRVLDVVGVSHSSTLPPPWTPQPAGWYDPRYSYEWFHAHYPGIPLVASEGSSCNTQRGVNVVNTSAGEWDDVHSADCLAKTMCPPGVKKGTNEIFANGSVLHSPGTCTQAWTMAYAANGSSLPFMAGTLGVWTLFDYLGEPSSKNRRGSPSDTSPWPQVSCNYGSFDLAGFAKPSAHFYRAWWLANVSMADAGRPPVCGTASNHVCAVVKIVHEWREPVPPIVAVYSSAPSVELLFDGVSLGRKPMGWANWTEWTSGEIATPFRPGNLTALAYDAPHGGHVVGRDEYVSPGAAVALDLTVDVPSPRTGTGEALLLDGVDVALLRVAVVDGTGRLVSGGAAAATNVSFRVVSGPGRIVGVGNGSPTSHERNKATWRTTYHGLARAIVGVTVDAASADRWRRAAIDAEDGMSSRVVASDAPEVAPIVVEAYAGGLVPARVTVATSADPDMAGVLAVASRSHAVDLSID